MGLDMYLSARVSSYRPSWEAGEPDASRKALEGVAEQIGLAKVSDNLDTITVTREVAYWRKANAIHQWFVNNCQGGIDECQQSDVSPEQLQELRDLCASLVASKDEKLAMEKLPPQEGFFFGSTDVDEYYWQDLADTVTQLDKIISLPSFETLDFIYQSSW